jgi:hypothetical protein
VRLPLIVLVLVVVRSRLVLGKLPSLAFSILTNFIHPRPRTTTRRRDEDQHEHEHDWGASSCRAYFRKRDTLRKFKYVRWIVFHFDYA